MTVELPKTEITKLENGNNHFPKESKEILLDFQAMEDLRKSKITEGVKISEQLIKTRQNLEEPKLTLADLVRLKSENSKASGGLISLGLDRWFTTDVNPVVGTSLIIEVELSDSSCSEDELSKSENIFR